MELRASNCIVVRCKTSSRPTEAELNLTARNIGWWRNNLKRVEKFNCQPSLKPLWDHQLCRETQREQTWLPGECCTLNSVLGGGGITVLLKGAKKQQPLFQDNQSKPNQLGGKRKDGWQLCPLVAGRGRTGRLRFSQVPDYSRIKVRD